MQLDQQQIIELLRERGDDDQASTAEHELPTTVDTEDPEHQNMLERFGIDVRELASRFLGGKGIPGL